MMMSREEEEQRQQSIALETSIHDYLEDDLDHLQLEEDEPEDNDDNVSDLVSRASSYGLGSSRASTSQFNSNTWRSDSLGHSGNLPSSPYMLPTLSPPIGPQSSSKIHLSPRLNPHLFGSPRSSPPPPDLNDVSDWPLPSPVGSAASPIALGSPRHSPKPQSPSPGGSNNTWSAIAGTSTKNLSKVPTRTVGGSSPSLLPSRLRPDQLPSSFLQPTAATTQAGPSEEEMDEELRFVLELSRAEEESRRAAQSAGMP